MYILALALLCVAYVSTGYRLQRFPEKPTAVSYEYSGKSSDDEVSTNTAVDTAKVFASLLFAMNPVSAFNLYGPTACFGRDRDDFAGSRSHRFSSEGRRCCAKCVPLMQGTVARASDFEWIPSEGSDASVPGPDTKLPEKNSVLRGVSICNITSAGCYAMLDPERNLQGFLHTAGLDSGYVRNPFDTFRLGDVIDVKVVGVSPQTGRLLLSRKLLMDFEGRDKHMLPADGRVMPKYHEAAKPPERSTYDPCVPAPHMTVPERDSILRGLKVVKVEHAGLFLEVDPATGLQGYIHATGLDSLYVRSPEKTFRVGDLLDVKVVGLGYNGRLLLSRKILMDEEGPEKHQLPDDGREAPGQK